jgi:hypothetical protein
MSLSDLAAIGSFTSGTAVFFSFFFLAFQLRQANRNPEVPDAASAHGQKRGHSS